MAKFKRFDPRNKKANKDKFRSKFGINEKRIHDIEKGRHKDEFKKQILQPQED